MPVLRFSALAWLKLQYLCQAADTEVGGFAISSPDDLLSIEDILTVKQQCTEVSVEFDDEAVADFFEEQVEQGRRPEQCGRIWVHTHPGDSPSPSGIDEETFSRVFGRCNWAVMFILARGGQTYCRLRVNSQSGNDEGAGRVALASAIPVHVDYRSLIDALGEIDPDGWQKEFTENVRRSKEGLLWSSYGLDERECGIDGLDFFDLDEFDLDEAMLQGLDPADESLWDEPDEEREEVDDDVAN